MVGDPIKLAFEWQISNMRIGIDDLQDKEIAEHNRDLRLTRMVHIN